MQYFSNRYGVDFRGSYSDSFNKLQKIFVQAGVGFKAHDDGHNEYYDLLTGRAYDHKDALNIVSLSIQQNGLPEEDPGPLCY